MEKKRVLVLGSTGSIGESTLQVADNLPAELEIVALAANANWKRLLEQTAAYRPRAVALTSPAAADRFRRALVDLPEPSPRVYEGAEGLVDLVRNTDGDVLVGAISGAAGLPANLAAVETGKDLALANKESLVMAGAILTRKARDNGRKILPVDSEHSAIFQSLRSGRIEEVETLTLTASGGPFRNSSADELRKVTRDAALRHPTWKMGEKITIDSATLMNKALEVIEAHWLFDMPATKIHVVVHPQSIIHSLVEFQDGSTICQLGHPDMKVPIQYALTYPRRRPLGVRRLRLAEIGRLTFQEPDTVRFPSLRLAFEVLEAGGTAPTVFNAANEIAVSAFLKEAISFTGIFDAVEHTLSTHRLVENPEIEDLFQADAWAREAAAEVTRSKR